MYSLWLFSLKNTLHLPLSLAIAFRKHEQNRHTRRKVGREVITPLPPPLCLHNFGLSQQGLPCIRTLGLA
jgi:hypothetical protein